MSITIDQTKVKNAKYSAYTNVNYVVTSDDNSIARMKCEVNYDLYNKNGNTTSNTITIELDPDLGTSGQFTLDVQILKNELLTYKGERVGGADIVNPLTVNTEEAVAMPAHKSIVEVTSVKFTEILDDGTTGTSNTATNNTFLIDGVLDYTNPRGHGERAFIKDDDYFFLNTRFPDSQNPTNKTDDIDPKNWLFREISKDEIEWLPCIADKDKDLTDLAVKLVFYDNDGGFLSNDSLAIDLSGAGGYDASEIKPHARFEVGVGKKQLEKSGDVSFPSDTKYYFVFLRADGFSETADNADWIFPYKLVNYSCRTTRFHFINQYGGFDAFTATGKKVDGVSTESTEYDVPIQSDYNIQDRGITELHITRRDTKTVWTGTLTKDKARWLRQLYTSPLVFVEENREFIPIIITNKDQVKVDTEQNIHNFPIEYIEAAEKQVQRG